MAKLGLVAALSVILAFVGVALTASPVDAAQACKRAKFATKDVKAACEKGGQKEAKAQMKAFLKKAKAKQADLTCQSCHTNLGTKYELKADGLERYKQLGGK